MKSNNTQLKLMSRTAVVAGIMLIGAAGAMADAAAPEVKKGWETTAAAGLTITRGTRDTLLVTAGLNSSRKWEKDEAALGLNGGYGEDNKVVNNEFLQGFGQYNRLFNERFYGGLRLDAAYDGIANLDYRVTISPLAGYYLIKNAKTSLAVEVGPSAVLEKYSGKDSDTYLGIRFAERFEHKLTDSTKIWQTASYVPQVDRWADNYIISLEAGIDTAITKQWSLRVVVQDVYTGEPAANTEHNELRLVAGTAYKF